MNWLDTIKLAWEKRGEIANGFYHTWVNHKPDIDAEAARRKAICESNACGYYDAEGKPETSSIPGLPACSICHCNINAKAHCTYCHCALLDINKEPLWNAIMTKEQDDVIQAKHYEEQFKQK